MSVEANEYIVWKSIINKYGENETQNSNVGIAHRYAESLRDILQNSILGIQQIDTVFSREKHLYEKILYKNANQHRNAKYFKRMKQV